MCPRYYFSIAPYSTPYSFIHMLAKSVWLTRQLMQVIHLFFLFVFLLLLALFRWGARGARARIT